MKSKAYHEAGHTIVAQHLGFDVEYTTIAEDVVPIEGTKTVGLKDYFNEDALMFGKLKVKGQESLSRKDYKTFYSILMIKLAGYVAIELAGFETRGAKHYDEDRAFALNTLNHLEKEKVGKKYEKMRRIVEKILRRKWKDVEFLANRLMEEKTVYFNSH
ncbi:MAG: hypothetical protein K9L66_06075 [Spirochaetaceae bacterium]|nr:hypothetical protein [Spirochaetaceae bacterium]MCF7951150.1 hypothetical protein [Spirochaetaceae bacterium]